MQNDCEARCIQIRIHIGNVRQKTGSNSFKHKLLTTKYKKVIAVLHEVNKLGMLEVSTSDTTWFISTWPKTNSDCPQVLCLLQNTDVCFDRLPTSKSLKSRKSDIDELL